VGGNLGLVRGRGDARARGRALAALLLLGRPAGNCGFGLAVLALKKQIVSEWHIRKGAP